MREGWIGQTDRQTDRQRARDARVRVETLAERLPKVLRIASARLPAGDGSVTGFEMTTISSVCVAFLFSDELAVQLGTTKSSGGSAQVIGGASLSPCPG